MNLRDRVGLGKLQPRCRRIIALRTGPAGAKHAHTSGKPPAGECQYVPAGVIKPLQIIDRDQDRRHLGEPLDDGEERGRDRALIGGRAIPVGVQQDQVYCRLLWLRQLIQYGRVDTAQQVGQGRVRETRFHFRRARRQHPESTLAGLLHGVQPQCRLADTRHAFHHQGGGLSR